MSLRRFRFRRALSLTPPSVALDWFDRRAPLLWLGSHPVPVLVLVMRRQKDKKYSNTTFTTGIADVALLARPLTSVGRVEVSAAFSCGRQKTRESIEPSWMSIPMMSLFFFSSQPVTLAPGSLALCNGGSMAPACSSNSFLFSSMAFLLPSSTRRSLSLTACSSSSCTRSLSPRSLGAQRRSKQNKMFTSWLRLFVENPSSETKWLLYIKSSTWTWFQVLLEKVQRQAEIHDASQDASQSHHLPPQSGETLPLQISLQLQSLSFGQLAGLKLVLLGKLCVHLHSGQKNQCISRRNRRHWNGLK